jgi:gamma-aminobutyric acid receptor subunit beta
VTRPTSILSNKAPWTIWPIAFFLSLALLVFPGGALGADSPIPLVQKPQRPESQAGPTKIGYAVYIADITRIDSSTQTFQANFMLILHWKDPRLAHSDPGVREYALADVWAPPILFENQTRDLVRSLPEIVTVAPDGLVAYRQRFIGEFSQALDLRAFPFDRGTFGIHLVTPGNSPEEILFQPGEEGLKIGLKRGIGIADHLSEPDWRILSTDIKVKPFSISPGAQIAACHFEFTAARNSTYFIIKVMLPLVLIVMMSWAVFWIDPTDSGAQFSIAVTAMLTLIAYRFAIDANVPKLPYLTCLDQFVLFSSLLVFVTLIQAIITSKLAKRGDLELARMIDRRSRWIFPLIFCAITSAILLF